MKKFVKGMIALFLLFGMAGCVQDSQPQNNTAESKAEYISISAEEAKQLMDTQTGYVIIDSRTQEEFDAGHIEGAIMIPEYEIAQRAERELPDKNQLILVYCRSGRRSKIASQALAELGYTNVREFGGIIDWPYETVK